MNILITGCKGQLGSEMCLLAAEHQDHRYFLTDVAELDITDIAAVERYVADNKIDIIVNCAAYTAVDRAESDEDTARLINADAVENIARAAAKNNAKVIHVSTDYVFSGDNCTPYREDDATSPTGAYGRTKLLGEQRLMSICPDSVILRTAWLYSPWGNNFMKTMLRLGNERESLNVVYDQVGSPTAAEDLAQAIFSIIEAPKFVSGIYHFTNEGVCSWYDFTRAIHHIADIQCDVQPIRSEQYPTPTKRPNYSVLDKHKIKATYGINIAHWYDALCRTIERYKNL